MLRSGWVCFTLIVLLLVVSGCTDDLGTVDLSTELPLGFAAKGWAYRNLAAAEITNPRLTPHSRLEDFRDQLAIEKSVSIGNLEYLIVTRFSTGFTLRDLFVNSDDESLRDFQVLVYSFDQHRLMKTFVTRQSDRGDAWRSKIGVWDHNPGEGMKEREDRVLIRNGNFNAVFHDPVTDWDCLIESEYSIKSTADFKTGTIGKPTLEVEGSSQVKLGFRQCLAGERQIGDRRIVFYVLDWNFDGQFSEADRVWNDYTEKLVPFGREVRLTGSLISSKDHTYVLKLIKKTTTTGSDYFLKIELKTPAKRA